MTDFRTVTPAFAVAPQLTAEDFARAAAAGYRVIVNNRPDGEAPGQLTDAEARAAAEAAGLAYHAIPFAGPPPAAVLDALTDILSVADGPVLAYCRTGTRCITAWALTQAKTGQRTPEDIVALAAEAGYDLSGTLGALKQLSGG